MEKRVSPSDSVIMATVFMVVKYNPTSLQSKVH